MTALAQPVEQSEIARILNEPGGWELFDREFPQADHIWMPKWTEVEVREALRRGYTDKEILSFIQEREQAIINEKAEPIHYGWEPQMWRDADALLANGKEILILGGNRCLGGEQEIYDPVARISRRVDSIDGPFHVWSWDGEKRVTAEALKPFIKPVARILRVTLSDGMTLFASPAHRVLLPSGEYAPFSQLRPGSSLFRAPSTWGYGHSVRGVSDRRYAQRGEDFPIDYPLECRFDDGQLRRDVDIALGGVPLPIYAQGRSSVCETNRHLLSLFGIGSWQYMLDDRGTKSSSNPWILRALLSILGVQDPYAVHDPTFVSRNVRKLLKRVLGSCRVVCQSIREFFLHLPIVGFAQWANRSCCELPYADSIPVATQLSIVSIEYVRDDVVWDFEVPRYHNYIIGNVTNHNSGKTEYAAKRVVQLMLEKPGASIWCFSTSFLTSVRDQQKMVWKYLPSAWKRAKRSKVTNVSYSQKGGFTQKVFVAPNGSECQFLNYQQDADVIEGGQVDLWWADELIPADWIITLRSRAIDRKGKGIITQTPIRGYSPTVAEYLNGAKVLEWSDCPELPNLTLWPGGEKGKVPLKIQCLNEDHRVAFFHPKNNPYIPYEDLVSAWKDKGTTNILVRLYGVTSGTSNCQFPRLGNHNIVPHENIPKEGTHYQIIDFASNRPWAMAWAKVIEIKDKKFIYFYREWPDMDNFGEWARRSEKADGSPGPAQLTLGYGIAEYKRLIYSLEDAPQALSVVPEGEREKIESRYGDPRSGSHVKLIDEGATSLFLDLEKDTDGAPSMIVEPVVSTGKEWHIREGVNLTNEWLAYDEDKPIDSMNCPSLYFSDKCKNIVECMKIWTGQGGEHGASKDFVDLVRYLAIMDPSDVSYQSYIPRKGGAY